MTFLNRWSDMGDYLGCREQSRSDIGEGGRARRRSHPTLPGAKNRERNVSWGNPKRNFSRFNGRGVTFQQKVTTWSQTVCYWLHDHRYSSTTCKSVYRTPVGRSHGNSCSLRIGPLCLWLQSLTSSYHIEMRGNKAAWRDCMAAVSLERRAGAATTLTGLSSVYGRSRRYVL
jgi:hypothetical protein